MTKGLFLISAFLFASMAGGCGGMRPPGPPPIVPSTAMSQAGRSKILDLEAGAEISFEELIHSLSAKDVVFVGEMHDRPAHHLIETQILQALLARWGRDVSIGMEFFPRSAQEVLDQYIRGDLKEPEFLNRVDWEKVWGYDYSLYRPLMLAARERSVRVLGLNAPSDIVKKVAREGLTSLTEQEKPQIARDIDLGNRAHREFLQKAYGEHVHAGMEVFEHFYEAQAVWDETMAETISDHMRRKGGKMIVFLGKGHILYRFGVPDRTARRVPVSMATVIPYPAEEEEQIERGMADFAWLTPGHPRLRQ